MSGQTHGVPASYYPCPRMVLRKAEFVQGKGAYTTFNLSTTTSGISVTRWPNASS